MTERLMVVDDNPGSRRLVRLALEGDPGFEVVAEAESADEAVEAAARARPDVALVDVLLPEGQGFRLPGTLHALVPGCVVVLTSAHAEGDLQTVRQLGGVALLSKAVVPRRLGRELVALISPADRPEDVLHEAVTGLPSSHDSPRVARRFVEGLLEAWGCESLIDTVTLLASELVANAVLHTSSEVKLSVRLVGDRIRVEVADRSTSLPRRRDAGGNDETGRGSDLVEVLTTAWGIDGRPDGKSIWFEIALPAPVLP